MADDYTHEEPMPADATRNLLLWASGFGAGAVIVLLGGVLLVGLGVLGHDSSTSKTPAAQSAANAPTKPRPNPQGRPRRRPPDSPRRSRARHNNTEYGRTNGGSVKCL